MELALALSKNATQFSQTQCMPPADILEEAIAYAAKAAKRAPVQRSLGGLIEQEASPMASPLQQEEIAAM